jgi:HK97 family phage major capsid protein
MNPKLQAFLKKKGELVASARALNDSADVLSDDDQSKYDAIMSDLDGINASIEREKNLIEAERQLSSTPLEATTVGLNTHDNREDDPTRGFKSYGDFLQCVHSSAVNNITDERLLIGAATPSTYGSEGVGADGGFLVPTEFSSEIFSNSLEGDALLPLTDNINIGSNSMVFPADETTPWGSNGIRAYWDGEAAAATETKPVLKSNTLRMNKLVALVPVTDELLSDGNAVASYLTNKTAESIRWKSNDAIINGTGAGMPEGITNSGAIISQAKEGSQTADTINKENVAKMLGRLPASSMGRAVWLINNDAYNQLITMNSGNELIWMPPSSGMVGAPAGTLLGRPVIVSQSCQTLGDLNDIILADFGSYRTITKAGGVETATSMHLYFDSNATAFRATFRMDGQSSVSGAYSPANGSSTLSPFVALAARA